MDKRWPDRDADVRHTSNAKGHRSTCAPPLLLLALDDDNTMHIGAHITRNAAQGGRQLTGSSAGPFIVFEQPALKALLVDRGSLLVVL